jgi:hypothetical protein
MKKIKTQVELLGLLIDGHTLKSSFDGSFWLMKGDDFPVRVLKRVAEPIIRRGVVRARKDNSFVLSRSVKALLRKLESEEICRQALSI